MSTSSTRAVVGRLRDALDPWSLAIVALSVVIVAPATTLWLYVGGLGLIRALLVESAGPTGVPIHVVAFHPLEHVLTEIAIGLGLAVFVGVDIVIAREWCRRRGFVARGPGSVAVVAGATAVWVGLAVAGGAVAVQTLGLPAVRLVATPVGTGPAPVRLGVLFAVVATVAVAGAIVPQALAVAAIRAWRRRSAGTDTAL
ncbi:hypothetical protein [Halococcoides cellulosivorans]|uniref:Uncharacterized protein n=1 Tax=Halococcoides cellulosivorans TaxID=1679096 RepID=A0A2R4X388_9EURY|nr:hypothetical protein [Halococcoides cellulosivorans]AWB28266.1 hypothetical protein HARCEL1_11410 [Halococcoides cellulosivorans]